MADIKFPAPINYDAVKAIKRLPVRSYNPDTQIWTVPDAAIPQTAALLRKFYPVLADELLTKYADITVRQEQLTAISKAKEISEIDDADIAKAVNAVINKLPMPEGLTLMPFQEMGVAYIELANGRALLGDEMGLGKTVQALAWMALHPEKRPALAIVPGKLRFNWEREFNKWVPNQTVQILKAASDVVEPGRDLYITSYELMSAHKLALLDLNISIVFLDEFTKIANRRAQRTRATLAIADSVDHIIGLSGTPIRNKTKEFYNVLNLVQPSMFPTFWQFAQRYCSAWKSDWGWNFDGSSNIGELQEILRQVMIRRLKGDVLKELPPKRRVPIDLELPTKVDALYRNAKLELEDAVNNFKDYQKEVKDRNLTAEYTEYLKVSDVPLPNQLSYEEFVWNTAYAELGQERMLAIVKLNLLRQIVGQGKAEQVAELAEPFFEAGEKLVIFGWHKDVLNTIQSSITKLKYKCVRVDGGSSDDEVAAAVDSFQEDEDCLAFITSLKEGLTLTAASNAFIVERDWTPADEEQKEGRIDRYGQTKPTTIWYLVVKDTIDDKLNTIVEGKRKQIANLLDPDAGDIINTTSVLSDVLKAMS